MSIVWIICGAGRGVGKTTLAGNLCKVLPAAVYAKFGHGETKVGKSANFFRSITPLESFIETCRPSREHIVVEANALARSAAGGLVIFIDGVEGKTHFRKDSKLLRAAADIQICRDVVFADWKRTLAGIIGQKALRDAVCGCLAAQHRYLFGAGPMVRTKVWFETSGSRVFGLGLARLLDEVVHLGTLREAAKASKMSYRHAWDLVRAAEKRLGKTLIVRQAGGAGGGCSSLAEHGKQLLDVFRRLNRDVAAFAKQRFSELSAMEKNND
ncbi:MAG: LysR family transcriptional regulator [Phycisphaerales bacterium]|nr:MAG: LysR family transcriptional regulator [Phycisphaerales bacterium]